MNEPYKCDADIYVLSTHAPIPTFGLLQINAFVILAKEPVLIDSSVGIESKEYLRALESVIDPKDIKWIWLTHDDLDHMGNIQRIMELAPRARLVTHAFCALRMGSSWPVPIDRVFAVRSGDSIDVGDRRLTAIKPPLFDNPSSLGVYDDKTHALFSVDTFGAILKKQGRETVDFNENELTKGIITWSTLDFSWVHLVDEVRLRESMIIINQLAPTIILSSHLPVARNNLDFLINVVTSLPQASPFIPPNQEIFSQMVSQLPKP